MVTAMVFESTSVLNEELTDLNTAGCILVVVTLFVYLGVQYWKRRRTKRSMMEEEGDPLIGAKSDGK